MQKIASLTLYLVYLAFALIRPPWIDEARHNYDFLFLSIIYVIIVVICKLVLLIRSRLVQYVYTVRNVLFYALFIVASSLLLGWRFHTGELNFYLLALLTSNLYDFILLLVKWPRQQK